MSGTECVYYQHFLENGSCKKLLSRAMASAIAVFITSLIWYVRNSATDKGSSKRKGKRKFFGKRKQDLNSGLLFHEPDEVQLLYQQNTKISQRRGDNDEDGEEDDDDYYGEGGIASGRVSSRGITCLSNIHSYQRAFFLGLSNPYKSHTNEDGYIPLCIAENKLVQEMLANRLMSTEITNSAFSDPSVYCYNGFLGLPYARNALAYFLSRKFLLPSASAAVSTHPQNYYSESQANHIYSTASNPILDDGTHHQNQIIDPEHIALGSGAGALLNNLFISLAKSGDVILIPAPYYAAFENNARIVAGCLPYSVQLRDPVYGPTPEDLEEARIIVNRMGYRCKILLLTNPNNPLGVNYRPSVVRDAIQWARSNRMHTVVDEVYALSQHYSPHSFQSVIHILQNRLHHDVHHLWSLSKDFGACGFRFGVLYTQNNLLLQAMANLNIFCAVSHPIQMVVADLLMDDDFIDTFLEESRLALTNSYRLCTTKLEEMVVPYIPSDAGIYVYADFSSLLPQPPTVEGEDRLATFIQDYARIVMTPGSSQRDRKPGMFRICYAWVPPDVLEVAMERLSRLIMKLRKMPDWSDDNFNADFLRDVLLPQKRKAGPATHIRRHTAGSDLVRHINK